MNEQNEQQIISELQSIKADLAGIKEVVGLIGLLMSKQNETKDNQ